MVKRKGSKSLQARKRRRTALEGPINDQDLKIQNEGVPETSKGPSKAVCSLQKPLTFANGVDPLHIDHILELVLQFAITPTATQKEKEAHADHETARCIRLVSRRWKETVTKMYTRARGPLKFSSGDGIEMKRFLDIVKNSSLIPVQKYAIRGNVLVQKNQQLLKDFMRICGPSATELYLTYDLCNTMTVNRRIFPNLNLLKLHSLYIHVDCSRLKFPNNNNIRKLVGVLEGAVDNFREFHKLAKVLCGAAQNLRYFVYEDKEFGKVKRVVRALREAIHRHQ